MMTLLTLAIAFFLGMFFRWLIEGEKPKKKIEKNTDSDATYTWAWSDTYMTPKEKREHYYKAYNPEKKSSYVDCCHTCGKKRYVIRDKQALRGITIHGGTCPFCHKEKGIVPAIDWMNAEDPRKYVEKYD